MVSRGAKVKSSCFLWLRGRFEPFTRECLETFFGSLNTDKLVVSDTFDGVDTAMFVMMVTISSEVAIAACWNTFHRVDCVRSITHLVSSDGVFF